jgi:hypothetical protein
MPDFSNRFRRGGKPWPVLRLLPGEAVVNSRNAKSEEQDVTFEELTHGSWWMNEFSNWYRRF